MPRATSLAVGPVGVIERLLARLWDPTGRKRREQRRRLISSGRKINRSQRVRERAMTQIRTTQDFVADAMEHLG